MQNSKQLLARRRELERSQAELVEAQDFDKAKVIEGQIKEIDITLDHVIEEEDAARRAGSPAPKPSVRLGELVLGARDEFKGIDVGFRKEVGFRNEDAEGVVSVAGPLEIELDLPGKSASLLNNFAQTLPSAPATGSVSYKQRSTQTGEPDTWAGVTDGVSAKKARVLYAWKDAVANKETIAGYVPVSKDTLLDYEDLLAIIESDLLIDLSEKENSKYLAGTNNTGIIGVQNTVGIQEYTTGCGGNYYEAIRRMRTVAMNGARRVPTHVCVHPDIKEAIDLYKTETGLYQFLGDGILWGMSVVEDFDCDGIIVYDAFAARKRPIHGLSVEVGYVNDQFIKNELCLLAERTSALQVVYPDAFVHADKDDLDANPSASE